MNFYPRYIGDYQRATSRLTLAEHGAYTLLLDDYYGTERPLPQSLDALCRICRANSDVERSAVERVASEFFPVADDGLRHHARVDMELDRGLRRIATAKKNGKKRGSKKASGIPSGIPSGLAPHPHPHKGITTTAGGRFESAATPVTSTCICFSEWEREPGCPAH